MKILKIIYLSLSMAFAIMAIHSMSIDGFAKHYWMLMISILFFFLYMLRFYKEKMEEKDNESKITKTNKK